LLIFRQFFAVVALAVAMVASLSAVAQTPVPPALEKEYDAVFQEMMQKPGDLDVLFRFATLASQIGDIEGAISALERMLLINADLPRVRLELGVLYFRLGSYEVARTYLQSVLKTQGIPPDVRAKTEQFLAEVESRQSPSRLVGEVFMGWRFQSNANLGPSTSSVRLFGQTANLNQNAVGAPDWGIVNSLSLRHTYDFGLQDRSALETTLVLYSSRQFTVTTANVGLIDFTTGPRFQAFAGTFEDVWLRPFVSAGYIWVNDTPYYGSYGGGLEFGALLGTEFRNVTTLLWRRHNHTDTWYLPTNNLFRGTEYSGTTIFQYQLNQTVGLFVTGSAQRYETDVYAAQAYAVWALGGGLILRFADPVFNSGLAWTLTFTASHLWWNYDAADVQVDPTIVRQQNDFIFNVTAAIPFDDRTTFTISAGRAARTSNLPNYVFDNNSVLAGVSWRF
jgi:tetratricopeptide (TPR) repeat protein